jgi:Putative transposase/Transposase zinc-binding domain
MPRPSFELADIFRQSDFARKHLLPRQQRRTMGAITACRTPALGSHVDECGQCGHTRISYNSCRNRHCPKCQSLARAKWLDARKAELLPVGYFHVVFTLPEEIARIAFYNPKTVFDILFRATAETLLTIARDPRHLGAEIGFFNILHTWGQNLHFHPHLHCVIPGGGLSADLSRWIACRPGFFLPVRVLSRLFRRLFLESLKSAFDQDSLQFHGEIEGLQGRQAFLDYLAPLARTEWVVYAKPPFGGPAHVLEYLGRYTHRVALSNDRLLSIDNHQVSFRYKDYRIAGREKHKVMTLPEDEFIRRFLTHVLPPGFQKIRFHGFLAHRRRKDGLALCRYLLQTPVQELLPRPADYQELYAALTARSLRRCSACGAEAMICVRIIPPLLYRFDTS